MSEAEVFKGMVLMWARALSERMTVQSGIVYLHFEDGSDLNFSDPNIEEHGGYRCVLPECWKDCTNPTAHKPFWFS